MSRITEAARSEPCTLNVAGVCNYNPETVVFAHFRWIGDCGTSIKPSDFQGAFACSECNRWTDSPTPRERDRDYECNRNYYAIRAIARTLKRLQALGVLEVK